MLIRRVILPLGLVVGLAFLLAADAEAGPVPGVVRGPDIYAGNVHVGFGVAVGAPVAPVRRHHVGHRHRVRPAGRWVIQEREVWHPGEFIGYDSHGRAVYRQGHWDVVRERVWVPYARRVVRPVVRPRTYVHIGVAGRIR